MSNNEFLERIKMMSLYDRKKPFYRPAGIAQGQKVLVHGGAGGVGHLALNY